LETVLQAATGQAPVESSSSAGGTSRGVCSLLQKGAIPLGLCVSLVALLRFVTYSSRRLWYDEIYTAIISLQPTWMDVWKSYCGGLDMQPPLFFGATRVSALLLGNNELALRFPEMLGVIIFSWCMYFFVAKRMGILFGLSAMILPLVTDLEFYAGEARPYGMLLAFSGLALLAWRNAIENPRRRIALPLFAASQALVAATHAYAILTVAVFAAAELVRYFQKRTADWPLWTCFLAASLPLPLYWFGLKTAKGIVVGPKMLAHWSDFPLYYHFFFRNRIGLLVLFGLLVIGLSMLRRGSKPRLAGFPLHEAALAGMLAVFPIFNITLAVLINQRFFPRYSIFGMAGIVILAIVLVDALAPSRQVASLALFILSVFLFGMDQLRESFNPEKVKTRDAELAVPYGSVPAGTPLVIASGNSFMPAEMYGSDSDLARTFYLTDRAASLAYSGSTIFDTLPNLEKFHPFRGHFADYRTFLREHKKFYAFGPYVYCDAWQIQKLIDDGARVINKGRYAGELTDNFLFEVEVP
jgi:hypothetical protein